MPVDVVGAHWFDLSRPAPPRRTASVELLYMLDANQNFIGDPNGQQWRDLQARFDELGRRNADIYLRLD